MCHVLGECHMESVLHVDFEACATAPVCFSVLRCLHQHRKLKTCESA